MWEGIVTIVEAETFTAILYDLDKPDLVEIGDFHIRVIELQERPMIKAGAVFTWSIEDGKSCFRFLRTGKMSEEEFEKRLEEISRQLALFSQPPGPSS